MSVPNAIDCLGHWFKLDDDLETFSKLGLDVLGST